MPSLFPPTPFTTFAVHPVHYFIKLNLLVRKITFFSLILPLRVHEHDDDVNVREEGGVGGEREERGTEGIYSLYMSAGRYTSCGEYSYFLLHGIIIISLDSANLISHHLHAIIVSSTSTTPLLVRHNI